MVSRIVLTFVLFSLAGAGAVLAAPMTSKPDPEHGRELAQRLCSNCHLVTSEQEQVNVDVPTFREIANMPDQTEGSIMAKIVIPKHPMPVIPITKPELNDLAAYIMSLREPVSE
jgi:mono/diheme cytochrome c family protein